MIHGRFLMANDEKRYHDLQDKKLYEWEALCRRCGACCGRVEGDPCSHLVHDKEGNYGCAIYNDRFGMRHTLGGREFYCVPIRDILHKNWPGDDQCSYKKIWPIIPSDISER